MPEPHSTTLGVATTVCIGLIGAELGSQVDALIISLVAAILISFWLPEIDGKIKAASAVALTSLLGGYWSPAIAGWLAENIAAIGDAGSLRMPIALAIGVAGPAVVPALLRRAKRNAEG
jgi:hypothetical protein